MFTGLIEAVGRIANVSPTPGGVRLRVETSLASELSNGDSLAIDGVCLTVVTGDAHGIHTDVSPETARVTTLGRAEPGALVNLERSLRADARLGGHFVQGHVDATGTVVDVQPQGESFWLTVRFLPALAAYMVRKGSIAVSGVSLTIAALEGPQFSAQIIPYTWTHTNLHMLKRGDPVNLECDILGKYVARALEIAELPAKVHGGR